MTIRLHGAFALAIACCVSGCIALPVPVVRLPGGKPEFRSTVGETPPAQIIPGTTTRPEVLLLLGEPDGRGVNDEWLTWGSVSRRAGVRAGVLVAGASPSGGATDYFGPYGPKRDNARRLLVRFDFRGVVSSTDLQFSTCEEGKWVQVRGDAGCLHPSAPELR